MEVNKLKRKKMRRTRQRGEESGKNELWIKSQERAEEEEGKARETNHGLIKLELETLTVLTGVVTTPLRLKIETGQAIMPGTSKTRGKRDEI